MATPHSTAFDHFSLGRFLDGPRRDIRSRMRRLLTQPRFQYRQDIRRDDYREVVLAWTQEIAERGVGPIGYPAEYGGEDSMSCFVGAFTILGHLDLSLLTKVGVQFGLFGGSIASVPAAKLGETVISAALARAGLEGGDLGEVIMGHVLQTAQGQNTARQASVGAGVPVERPASTINQVCGSGLPSWART